MKTPTIGIFGHYGNKNLGDEAIIEAAIQNLRKLLPEARLIGMSINPEDTHNRYNIESFPIRYKKQFFDATLSRSNASRETNNTQTTPDKVPAAEGSPGLKTRLKKFWPIKALFGLASRCLVLLENLRNEWFFLGKCKQLLDEMDLIIVCGSNQFLDNFGGAWGFPYTLMKWTLMAKSKGTKVAFVSVGAGPLDKKLSYWMLAKALRKADYISYRDQGSKDLVESGISGIDAPVYPDVAHSLLMTPGIRQPTDKPVLGLNPMPVFDSRYWYTSDTEKYNKYVSDLCIFIKHVIDAGYTVNIFNTQIKDLVVVEDILDKLHTVGLKASNLKITEHQVLGELIDTLAHSDIVVATRFHATVLPLRLGKPVIGICYYRKAAELLDDVGLNKYHVDIANFDADDLIMMFDDMVKNKRELTENVNKIYSDYKTQLDEQWANIVGLLN